MANIYDLKKILSKERKVKTYKGHILDFSFRPSSIDLIYSEYIKLVSSVSAGLLEHNKKTDIVTSLQEKENYQELPEYKKAYQELEDLSIELNSTTEKARNTGYELVKLAAECNGQDFVTTEWIQNEIDHDEFNLIISYIMELENPIETKKK